MFTWSRAVLETTPVPAVVAETAVLVLLYVPVADAATLTVTVHMPPAAMAPPENAIDVLPVTGLNVGDPQPDVENVAGDATVMAPGEFGKLSLKATPLSAVVGFGFVIWNVMADAPRPARMVVGENDFVITGGMSAVREAVANPLDPVLVPDSVAET